MPLVPLNIASISPAIIGSEPEPKLASSTKSSIPSNSSIIYGE